MIRRIAWTNNKMLRAVGTVAAAFLGSVILFSPINLGAQTQDPCWTNGAADQRIAACTALLASGTLSATDTIAAYNNRGRAYHAKGQDDLAIADYNAALVIDPNVAIVYTIRVISYGV
jgi:tetratricopeptide (TPR) repeat protein